MPVCFYRSSSGNLVTLTVFCLAVVISRRAAVPVFNSSSPIITV